MAAVFNCHLGLAGAGYQAVGAFYSGRAGLAFMALSGLAFKRSDYLAALGFRLGRSGRGSSGFDKLFYGL